MAKLTRNEARIKKHKKIRTKIHGTSTKPRLCVFKSLQNFYAQLIDDDKGVTIASVSTVKNKEYSGNIKAAKELGKIMAKKIKDTKVKTIVFDRSGYIYHGRVKAFAEAIRKEGVKF